jgi:iron(III) transport system substrate-binding protein
MGAKIGVLLALALVLAVPFLVRSIAGDSTAVGGTAPSSPGPGIERLIVVTPHVEQIRAEFSEGFDRWHRRIHGTGVYVDWRTPGGTSEIVKQLEATLEAAARNGRLGPDGLFEPGVAGYDLFFGGGSFEHGNLKNPRSLAARAPGGEETKLTYALSRPAGFDPARMREWFGENKIGAQTLYDAGDAKKTPPDPGQYWIGTALSGFGIMYNRDALRDLGLPEPRTFADLCDPQYFNALALTDGRLSGSVTTTYESIMNKEGWAGGWKILREMAANARYFASAATRPPIDVSQGEAAAALSIDFYGRGQAQFTLAPGQDPATARVGYVDPAGAVYVDADPATILNGAANFELAKRFIEYCLTEEAQALWQFPSQGDPRSAGNPVGEDGTRMGPRRYELRRMPVRRVMYEKYAGSMIDPANPFDAAADLPRRGWRDAIGPMMAAFGIDTGPDLRRAWRVLNSARAAAKTGDFSSETLARMEAAFYAMPPHTMRDGRVVEFSEATFRDIRTDTGRWRDPVHGRRSLIAATEFFREQYRTVIDLGDGIESREPAVPAGSTP